MDAGMIGVAGDAAVGDAASHPYGTLVVLAFAYHFENPNLVGVGNREGFALRGVAVLLYKVGHHLEGLSGGLGAFKTQVNQ